MEGPLKENFTLDDIEKLVGAAHTAADLFGRAPYQDLIRATHPDRHPNDPRAESLFRRIQALYHGLSEPPLTIHGPARTYTLWRKIAAGDIADVHFATTITDAATGAEAYHVLKVARTGDAGPLLENERRTLTHLLGNAGDSTYRQYLPVLTESFRTDDRPTKRINVFQHELGLYTLEQLHERHPQLDGRHLAWIFNRLLMILGFCHRQKKIHGAILPPHVLIHTANHGLQLVGWGHSVEAGRRLTTISTRFRDWYPPEVLRRQDVGPSTDLFLAARCLVYLAGGDPITNRMPDSVPNAMQRFLAACLLEGPRMRPDDAWKLQEEFDALLKQLYGPRTFHELSMTP